MPGSGPRSQEAAAYLAAFMDSSEDAMISRDLTGTVTGWNRAAERIFGYTADEMIGSSIARIIPLSCRGEDAEIIGRLSSGERVAPYETIRLKKDGQLCHLSMAVSPVFNDQGRVIGASHIACDVTGTKRAQQALHEREERWRVTLERIGDAVVTTDASATVTSANAVAAELLGRPCLEMIGRPLAEILTVVHEDTRRPAVNPVDHVVQTGAALEAATHTLRRPDGTEVPIDESAAPIRDSGGRVAGVVLVFRDITASTRAHRQLQRRNAELEARVRERSHELVRSQERLRGLASQLSQTEQRERRRLAADLHDFLAQLLSLARIKVSQLTQRLDQEPAGKDGLAELDAMLEHSLRFTRTLMAQLNPAVLRDLGLVAALEWLAQQMSHQGLTVTVQAQTGAPPRFSEDQADLLFQAVRELLRNVMKHARVSQALVSIDHQGSDVWLITVQDHGVGFDIGGGDSRPSGEHFGLFSIQERMEAMSGWCLIDSVPGKGTKVELGLAVTPEPATLPQVSQMVQKPDAKCPAQLSRWRVLLVDGHATVRQGLRSILDSSEDLEVVGEAADGEEAVTCARSLHPDVVVMDVDLPRLSGIHAIRRIKQEAPKTVVIGLSFHCSVQTVDALLEAGAAAILSKEQAADDLYRTIAQCLG